jgi:hypothetical protein
MCRTTTGFAFGDPMAGIAAFASRLSLPTQEFLFPRPRLRSTFGRAITQWERGD